MARLRVPQRWYIAFCFVTGAYNLYSAFYFASSTLMTAVNVACAAIMFFLATMNLHYRIRTRK